MNPRGRATLLRLYTCVSVLVLLFAGLCAQAQNVLPGTLLIRLAPGISIWDVARDYDLTVLDNVAGRDLYEALVPDPTTIDVTAAMLDADHRVLYCEEESSLQLPEIHAGPFHLAFDRSSVKAAYADQAAYTQVDATTASTQPATRPVTVAILDTGVDISHPDLAGRLVAGYNVLSPGDAPLDLPDGVDNSVVGHGTMIAGIIAHVSSNAVILPIRVLNADGIGTMMNVIQGIHFAVTHGAQVINMSFGSATDSAALSDAIDEARHAGVVLVASAGNDGTNSPSFPAAYSDVIGVASVDLDSTLSSFSNYGIDASVEAPGDGIRSTYWDGGYATWSGTSFAAPFVAAEAVEVLAQHRGWNAGDAIFGILSTAQNIDSLNPGYELQLGAGLIDIQAAIDLRWNGRDHGRGHGSHHCHDNYHNNNRGGHGP